jgi:hypothetical protein
LFAARTETSFDSILLSSWVSAAPLPRPLCRYESIILFADDIFLLTLLRNVVAYVCRPYEKRIGVMFVHFSVVLSEAKDLIAACHGHEILRFAQDDNSAHLPPTTSVSGTKVFPRGLRRPAIAISLAEIAGIAKSVGLPTAQNSRGRPAVANVSATNVFSPNSFKDLAFLAQSSSGAAPGVIGLSHLRNRTVTCGS